MKRKILFRESSIGKVCCGLRNILDNFSAKANLWVKVWSKTKQKKNFHSTFVCCAEWAQSQDVGRAEKKVRSSSIPSAYRSESRQNGCSDDFFSLLVWWGNFFLLPRQGEEWKRKKKQIWLSKCSRGGKLTRKKVLCVCEKSLFVGCVWVSFWWIMLLRCRELKIRKKRRELGWGMNNWENLLGTQQKGIVRVRDSRPPDSDETKHREKVARDTCSRSDLPPRRVIRGNLSPPRRSGFIDFLVECLFMLHSLRSPGWLSGGNSRETLALNSTLNCSGNPTRSNEDKFNNFLLLHLDVEHATIVARDGSFRWEKMTTKQWLFVRCGLSWKGLPRLDD